MVELRRTLLIFRSKSGIIVVDSSKAGMRFRNKDLESMNKEYRKLGDDFEEKQKKIVNGILGIAWVFVKDNFQVLCKALTRVVRMMAGSILGTFKPFSSSPARGHFTAFPSV